MKPDRPHVSNGEVSAIASDSSYADIFNDKMLSDDGIDIDPDTIKKQSTKTKKLKKEKTYETERSTS